MTFTCTCGSTFKKEATMLAERHLNSKRHQKLPTKRRPKKTPRQKFIEEVLHTAHAIDKKKSIKEWIQTNGHWICK